MTSATTHMTAQPTSPEPEHDSPGIVPSTPPMSRPRSDTILTTSSASSSSSPQLQTPQTPSILGVLDSYNRHRSDSYGFSEFGKTLFPNNEVESSIDTIMDGTPANVDNVPPSRNADPESARNTSTLSGEDPAVLPSMSDMTSGSSPSDPTSPGEMIDIPPEKSKQRASSKVRAKLQRSKSSLKDILRISSSTSATSETADAPNTEDDKEPDTRRRPRLRSLLSMSRAGSRASSTTSIRTLETPAGPQSSSTRLEVVSAAMAPEISSDARRDVPLADSHPSTMSVLVRSPVVDNMAIHDHLEIIPRRRTRPMHMSTLSSGRVLQYTTPAPPITRSVTDPVIVQGTFQTTSTWQDRSKRDLFTTMLPRELKVMILKTVLEMGSVQEREARWDGEVGARKELIRLSRVSKAWQALCFDGQLWPVVDLAPFVSVLHPGTLGRIIEQSGPFIRTLSLHGMDHLKGSTLVGAIAQAVPGEPILTSLTTLDLRGCKKLHSTSLLELIAAAPNVRHVNLKGVQSVSSEVIRALARGTSSLESLDVSRCWDISLCDLCVFIKMLSPSQARQLKVLRAAGLKAYGHGSDEFLSLVTNRLVNLETLDLLGCTHILDAHMISAASSLEAESRHSNLRHLVLSGCMSLTASIFPSMTDVFPNLTRLELASMPEMFGENGNGSKGFHDFLKTLPNLERLDLDGTGSVGGVNDKMLAILTPARGESGALEELRIGYAKGVTPEGLIRFIRGCTTLRNLEADNTSATNAVMREFYRRHSHDASITLVDCRAITPVAYSHLSSSSRPRDGSTGYPVIPMGYHEGEIDKRVVIKVFWSWRRVGVVKGWREVLRDKEKEHAEHSARGGSGNAGTRAPAGRGGRKRGWWKNDEPFDDDRAGCVVQ